jgi:hypothetical protein
VLYPGNGYSLATNVTTSPAATLPILGISQFIPVCPDVGYTMYFYYAVTDKSQGAAAAAVTGSSAALKQAGCQLYYGFSFNPLPPNFGSAATWMGAQATAFPYFSSTNNLGDSSSNFNLLQASITAAQIGARNGTYIQVVLGCSAVAPQSFVLATGWLSLYLDNFFLTSP